MLAVDGEYAATPWMPLSGDAMPAMQTKIVHVKVHQVHVWGLQQDETGLPALHHAAEFHAETCDAPFAA